MPKETDGELPPQLSNLSWAELHERARRIGRRGSSEELPTGNAATAEELLSGVQVDSDGEVERRAEQSDVEDVLAIEPPATEEPPNVTNKWKQLPSNTVDDNSKTAIPSVGTKQPCTMEAEAHPEEGKFDGSPARAHHRESWAFISSPPPPQRRPLDAQRTSTAGKRKPGVGGSYRRRTGLPPRTGTPGKDWKMKKRLATMGTNSREESGSRIDRVRYAEVPERRNARGTRPLAVGFVAASSGGEAKSGVDLEDDSSMEWEARTESGSPLEETKRNEEGGSDESSFIASLDGQAHTPAGVVETARPTSRGVADQVVRHEKKGKSWKPVAAIDEEVMSDSRWASRRRSYWPEKRTKREMEEDGRDCSLLPNPSSPTLGWPYQQPLLGRVMRAVGSNGLNGVVWFEEGTMQTGLTCEKGLVGLILGSQMGQFGSGVTRIEGVAGLDSGHESQEGCEPNMGRGLRNVKWEEGFGGLVGGLSRKNSPEAIGEVLIQACEPSPRKKFRGLEELALNDRFLYEKVSLTSVSGWSKMTTREKLLKFKAISGPIGVKVKELNQHKKVGGRSPISELGHHWKKRKREKWRSQRADCAGRKEESVKSVNLEGKVDLKGDGMLETRFLRKTGFYIIIIIRFY
ncbi:unnamed protein product [Linum trigynum]|uniref:Uncharacterized protein n=1 Tax=Linum trigynum TaxID=586398 RepID=A0AAV2CUF5_9ROSI